MTKRHQNLKAVAAADQENARVRDERDASPDGMTTSERAMADGLPVLLPDPKEEAERNAYLDMIDEGEAQEAADEVTAKQRAGN